MKLALFAPLLALATACHTAAPAGSPRVRTAHEAAQAAPDRGPAPSGSAARLAAAQLPKGPDLHQELMGYVVISDAERVAHELSPSTGDRHALDLQLAALIGLDPQVAQVLDWKRPAAMALLNPTLLVRSGVRPYVVMVPVISREAAERVLKARAPEMEPRPWGLKVKAGDANVYIAFTDGYAVLSWKEELLAGAVRLLQPKLQGRHDAPVVAHIDVDNVYGAFGPQLEAMLGQLARVASSGQGASAGAPADPQSAFAMRGLKHLIATAESVSALEVLLDLDSGGLTVTARLDGKPAGAWASYVGEQKPGPAWGTQYLPRDAVLAYVTHASPKVRADDLRASVLYLSQAVPSKKPEAAELGRWQSALEGAVRTTGGDLAYAVWPGRAGGVGVGGAYRVTDPGQARAAVMRVYDELGPQLGGLLTRALVLDPQRFAARFTSHKRQAQLGGVDIDLVELEPSWPDGARAEKRLFEAMFGPRLTMATAFVGEQALFCIGADWQPRLEAMLATARGQRSASLADEADFAEALQYHAGGRVSMSWLETAKMARFAAALLDRANDLDPKERQAVATLLNQVGRGAIVTTTNASGRRYELTTHIPQSAIVGTARLNGALWRIALSSLVNPPMMPPMPVPPPHVAPTMRSQTGPSL